MLTTLLLTALLAIEPTTQPAEAPPEMSPQEMEAMMEAYMKAGEPSKMHKLLDPFIGEWKTTSTTNMPDGSTMTAHGAASSVWVMDGRFVQQSYEGDMMGMAFTGMSMMGFDNIMGKYQSVWVDSMSSGMAIAYGTVDEAGTTFTFEGKYADPMTGGMKPYKQEFIVDGPDQHTFKMYEQLAPGGELVHTFTIVYERD